MRTLKICRSQTLRKYRAHPPESRTLLFRRTASPAGCEESLRDPGLCSVCAAVPTATPVHALVSREMNVIDNQRILNQLSNKLEPRQT